MAHLPLLAMTTGSIDVALCLDVLEQAPAPMRIMAELGRVLRAEGRLFLCSPLVVGPQLQRPDRWRERTGLNQLLEASSLVLERLTPMEGGRYAVIARKPPVG